MKAVILAGGLGTRISEDSCEPGVYLRPEASDTKKRNCYES
jgi:dTDP-glucose pyrophosphorylase